MFFRGGTGRRLDKAREWSLGADGRGLCALERPWRGSDAVADGLTDPVGVVLVDGRNGRFHLDAFEQRL